MSKTETPDIVERLRRDLETLRPYIGRPIGGEGSAARIEQENKSAAYKEAVEMVNLLSEGIEALSDPVVVHINMLRGVIAKPSWPNILHLYPEKRDDIERLHSELAKHQWRAMDGAPRDGTYVLVWRPDEGDGHHEAHVGIDCYLDSSWYRSRRNQQPTHWQPLPSPPGENDGGSTNGESK